MKSISRTLSFLILTSSLLTGVVSCQKERDHQQDTPPPAANRLVEYKNDDEFIRLQYNTDGTVKKATISSELNTDNNVVDYNITYNSSKKIASIETSAGERIVPVYDNGVLIRADVFEGTERTGFNNYYFENGLLKRTTLYWGSGTDFQPYFEFNFKHDAAGNTIEVAAFIATEQIGHLERMGHVELKYDSKTNPLYDQKDLLALLYQSASKNNVIEEKHFDAQLHLEDQVTYSYIYNAKGLPEKGVVKQGLPGEEPFTTNVEYFYN